MNKTTRFNLVYVLIAMTGVLVVHDLWVSSQAVAVIPCSLFQQLLAQGKVQEVVIDADSIQGVPVRFADVAGVDEAKAELEEVVSFLKDPKS